MKYYLKAFSLVELLVTVALVGILAMLTIPPVQYMIAQNRALTQVNQIVAAINFARSEAISRGVAVSFCKTSDQKTCGGQWRDGQIILASGKVLRVYPALANGDTLVWASSLGKNEALQLLPTGFTNGQKGSFYYCPADKDLASARRIVVEQTGRIRVTADGAKCV